MPFPSFHEWLDDHPPEVPDVGALALQIAQAGKVGVSRDQLARILGISLETLEVCLRALVTTGQVMVVRVGREMGYRATM